MAGLIVVLGVFYVLIGQYVAIWFYQKDRAFFTPLKPAWGMAGVAWLLWPLMAPILWWGFNKYERRRNDG